MIFRSHSTGHLGIFRNVGFVNAIILTLSMTAIFSHAFTNSMLYVRNLAYDDIILTNEQLACFETKSKLMCFMLCNQNDQCQSISYNSISMICQLFLVKFWDRPVIGTNESGWLHYDSLKVWDCKELYEKKYITGIYSVCPERFQCFTVKCEMDEDGGGWTVIQERFDGTVDFNRTWIEYKTGFGDLNGEFWLGNDHIHTITTSANYELRTDMSDWHNNSYYAVYKTFRVGDEHSQYQLTIGNHSGTAGDSMAYHNGMRFSTMDRDNDEHSTVHCSIVWGGNGGWWYNGCDRANLNSLYGRDIGEKTGNEWESVLGKGPATMKTTRMMIRKF